MSKKPIAFLKKQWLPTKDIIVSLYSIIVFMVYSWTIITFFYGLPSWMMYLTTKEILIIFSYAMSIDLFESLIILGGLLVLYLLSPQALLKEDFSTKGTWLAISYLGMLMLYFSPSLGINQWIGNPWLWAFITCCVAILFVMFISRLGFMKKIAYILLDRMPVFLGIFIPISVISFFIVTIHLLF